MDNWVGSGEDAAVVPISFFQDFKLNEELRSLAGKRWVLADTCEWYGEWPDGKSHLFGISPTPPFSGNFEWQKFSNFVRENPPILQLVRELYKEDVSKFIQPLEWPCVLDAWPIEDKLNFDRRPLEVFFQYGISSCFRPILHGEGLKRSCEEGYEVINSLDHIDAKINEPQRKWALVHQPHTHRVPITEVVRRQAQSKITVSLKGAGWKCFRSTEAPVHSVPAIHSPGLAWAFDWEHGYNCIHLTPHREWADLVEEIKLDRMGFANLHEIYVNAQRTIDLYRPHNYINQHILPAIERVL
jgi:hypothetical protein